MGRRSFAKIQGRLDLTGCFILSEELAAGWNPSEWFGRTAPLELEIGSGKGLFLRKAAATCRAHDFLGIEVAYRYALISAAGLAREKIANAKMLHADAATLLTESVPAHSLTAVHIYFPDPWWKKAHRKRRMMRTEVVRRIEEVLLPGGRLFFRTDVEEYYRETLTLIAAETKLSPPFVTDAPEIGPNAPPLKKHPVERGKDNPPAFFLHGGVAPEADEFSTHFERRTRLNRLPIFGCFFVK